MFGQDGFQVLESIREFAYPYRIHADVLPHERPFCVPTVIDTPQSAAM